MIDVPSLMVKDLSDEQFENACSDMVVTSPEISIVSSPVQF